MLKSSKKVKPKSRVLPLSKAGVRPPVLRSKGDKSFPIVGVGASAGGLQAFKELLQHLPRKLNMALVLVQHLEPSHESILAEILTRETHFTVVQGSDRQPLEAGHIYIIPPNAYISIVANCLRISPRVTSTQQKFLPIDYFLNSLAKARKEKAVAVILSGTGSDGTQGAKAVHAAGGITLAQTQETALFPEMPASALAAKCIDLVLSPKEIAEKLAEIVLHPGRQISKPKPAVGEEISPATQGLDEIFRRLQKVSGVDFAHYKRPTIQRRINRRMGMHNLKNHEAYFAYLEKQPEETDLLLRDFLIPVTSFFRDPGYFAFLEKKVYPALLNRRKPNDILRVWIPGCSTGEEAYSLAISLSHYLSSHKLKQPIQIFGTDVNEIVIAKARAGSYPAAISKHVPAPLLKRYFAKNDEGYRIDKSIRDLCLFSRHNVLSDPPFSNIDLLSFRNVLIYMDAALQGRVFPLLHFALKPEGFLMLGTSESVSAFPSLFNQMDKRYKIFSRKAVSQRERFNFMPSPVPGVKPGTAVAALLPEIFSPEKEIDRLLIKKYLPAGVLVNNQLEVLQFRGHTGAFLEPAAGRVNLNLLSMAREGLWSDLRKVIAAARKQDVPAKRQALVKNDHGVLNVTLEVTPLHPMTSHGKDSLFFIAFEAAPAIPQGKARPTRERGRLAGEEKGALRLRRENAELKEYQQSLRSEMENSSEELKAAQEEMQSSNEELQSMNEELETSKEELQSTNEELVTTNDELKGKNQDLLQINNDLGNVLSGIDLPLVILDQHLQIRRFTPSAKTILNIVGSDVGRSISELKLKLPIPDLEEQVSQVVKIAQARTLEIGDSQRGWFTLVIKPYITTENKIEGALLAFYDVTRIKESQLYSENIVATVREPLVVLDAELKVISANRAFYQLFQVKAKETEGRCLYVLGQQQWDIPELRELLGGVIPRDTVVEDFTLTFSFPHIGDRTMLLNARRINQNNGKQSALMLLAIEDITDRQLRFKVEELEAANLSLRQAREALEEKNNLLEGVFSQAWDGIVFQDVQGHALLFNPAAQRIMNPNSLGAEPQTELRYWGQMFERVTDKKSRLLSQDEWPASQALRGEDTVGRALHVVRPDGSEYDLLVSATPLKKADGTLLGAVTVFTDITSLRQAERVLLQTHASLERRVEERTADLAQANTQLAEANVQLAEADRRKDEFLAMLAHELRNPLAPIQNTVALIQHECGQNPKMEKWILTIRRQVFNLTHIVNDLLDTSRISQGLVVLEKQPVNLTDMIQQAYETHYFQFEDKRQSLTIAGPGPQVPLFVAGDPVRLAQILSNLLDNANKYTPTGGSITLRAFPQDRVAVIEVCDTGLGISAEDLPRIFGLFYQTQRSLERTKGGLGLGLTLSRDLVLQHGGTLEVHSEGVNLGSTFTVRLPLLPAVSAGPAPETPLGSASQTPGTPAHLNVLLVEDNQDNAESFAEILTAWGCDVRLAPDGVSALEQADAIRPDVVLLDIGLAGMDGYEVAARLRANPKLQGVALVAVTGYNPEKSRMESAGFRDYFTKPMDLDVLEKLLRNLQAEKSL